MTVPAEFAGYTRHMIVRDPYARLVSIYGYLRRRPGEWGSALAAAVGFSAWVEWFLSIRRTFDPLSYDAKAPAIWLATQAECWHLLRGDRFWKLEEIGRFLVAVGIRAELPRINVSRQVEAPEGCSDLVWDEWCREDCATFGYGRA